MKKLLALIVSLSLCGVFFVGCTNYYSSSSSSSSQYTPEELKYTITYYAVIDGGTPTAITADMKVENGQYPTEYIYGTGATFSELQSTVNYEFKGWYINAACTAGNEFGRVISETDTGNKSFYAKFVTNTQNPPSSEPEPPTPQTFTISYKIVMDDELQTDTTVFETVFETMKGTATYPVEYTYGTGATVPDLNDEDEYDFEGWFVDATCAESYKFMGIGATDSGEKTLYAKVTTKADIVYLKVVGGGEPKPFDDMDKFKPASVEGKSYPIEYKYNTKTKVDDLQNYGDRYDFVGWYLDEECTEEFSGTIDATNAEQRGTLTLYAKINVMTWTRPY